MGWRQNYWRHVTKCGSSECWPWLGAKANGYGVFRGPGGKAMPAHRAALMVHGVRLEPRLTVDHLCGNRWCQNPAHMEQVSRGENVRRALRSDTCRRGHTLKRTPAGRAWCPQCQRDRRAAVVAERA